MKTDKNTTNEPSLTKLEKSYTRVNLYFIIIAFTSAIIVISGDALIYFRHHYHFLLIINLLLLLLILTDIVLLFSQKILIRTAFLVYLYTILFNISLTHLQQSIYDNFVANCVMIGFWGMLLAVISGIALGKWHPYLVISWAVILLTWDIIKTKNNFLSETVPVILVSLIGISCGVSMYMNILRRSFQNNEKALSEISKQKDHIEKQAQALEINNKNLSELQNMQKDLIEMLMHDMKNPLNSILMNASKPYSLQEKKSIYEAGRQMLVLVENMLDIYRMENGKPRIVIGDIPLGEAIQKAFEMVSFLVYQHGLSMEIKVNQRIFVKADREILIRVLVNLFTNAIKHSPDNSCLTVTSSQYNREEIAISVKDQGEGIPELYKEKVFGKYVQAISQKSGSARSTGLGLTFCKMSIELMNGKIWIADSSPHGTIVTFTLPLTKTINIAEYSAISAKNEAFFLPEERSLLKPIVFEIKQLEIYKAGLIFNALNKIKGQNRHIDTWIEDIKNAVCASNVKRFHDLLEIV